MLDISCSKTGDNGVCMRLSGDLTVNNAAAIHKKICEYLDEAGELVVEMGEVSNIDMTFVQLVCISHRAFTLQDKHFGISGDMKKFHSLTDEAGFTRHKGCAFDKFCTCALVKKGGKKNG